MGWLPLSIRNDPPAIKEYDALHEGVPEWMAGPIARWVFDVFDEIRSQDEVQRTLDVVFGMLRRSPTSDRADGVTDLANWARSGDLDVLDVCVWLTVTSEAGWRLRERLDLLLSVHGSAWKLGSNEQDQPCLERRVDSTVHAAAKAEMDQAGNAAAHLHRAWHRIYGRTLDSGGAYREAVRAVEAAAKPVISPTNASSTLGTMLADLRNKPEKWDLILNEGGAAPGVPLLIAMLQGLWKSQLDRHGTDDASKPLDVTKEDAEAAVHLAVTLVHWFRTGAVRQAQRLS